MQKELRGVNEPLEAFRSRVRKQQNQWGNVRNPQESSESYKTKLTDIIAHFFKKDGQVEDREKKYRPYREGLAIYLCL